MSNGTEIVKQLEKRISELSDKSSQTLLFLSFALVVVATLLGSPDHSAALKLAMWWWERALFPILLGILPLKGFGENKRWWYCCVRWAKFALLWTAIVVILAGAYRFAQAI